MDDDRAAPFARDESASAEDDAAVADALRRGCRRTQEWVVRRYWGWLSGVARRIVRDPATADDCVQDAFVKAFRKADTFEGRAGGASLAAWLRRITVNEALMRLRARRAHEDVPLDVLDTQFDRFGCRMEPPWTNIETAEERADLESTRRLVRAHIDQLPEGLRTVLVLRDIEEMTTAEVADALDLTETNVKVRLHRARAALKRLLEPVFAGDVPL